MKGASRDESYAFHRLAPPPSGRLASTNVEDIFMTEKSSFFKQSGRRDLPESERRKHSVNVRFNDQELADLDAVRGSSRRAETLRLLAFSHFPAPIPLINSELRTELGKALGNLSTAAVGMRAGEYREISQLVIELREKLSVAVK